MTKLTEGKLRAGDGFIHNKPVLLVPIKLPPAMTLKDKDN